MSPNCSRRVDGQRQRQCQQKNANPRKRHHSNYKQNSSSSSNRSNSTSNDDNPNNNGNNTTCLCGVVSSNEQSICDERNNDLSRSIKTKFDTINHFTWTFPLSSCRPASFLSKAGAYTEWTEWYRLFSGDPVIEDTCLSNANCHVTQHAALIPLVRE